jgi:hypothetical protein
MKDEGFGRTAILAFSSSFILHPSSFERKWLAISHQLASYGHVSAIESAGSSTFHCYSESYRSLHTAQRVLMCVEAS